MNWRTIDTGRRSANENMALDAALLSDLQDEEDAIIHLYDWEQDAATYGYFIEPVQYLKMDGVSNHALDLAKRPTGGGIIFHKCDFAFSILVPATHPAFSSNVLDNYAFVNRGVIQALSKVVNLSASLLSEEPRPFDESCKNFCMAKPTKYDVMVHGKKVGGAAQRKTRAGFLHQGSVSIGLVPEDYLDAILLSETQVIEGMRANSFSLLGESWTQSELTEMRQELREHLCKIFIDGEII